MAGAPEQAQPRECAGSIILIRREIEKMRLLAGARDAKITAEALSDYFQENPRGISKRGMTYWLIERLHLGGVPMLGGPVLPEVDRQMMEDHELIARLPD